MDTNNKHITLACVCRVTKLVSSFITFISVLGEHHAMNYIHGEEENIKWGWTGLSVALTINIVKIMRVIAFKKFYNANYVWLSQK